MYFLTFNNACSIVSGVFLHWGYSVLLTLVIQYIRGNFWEFFYNHNCKYLTFVQSKSSYVFLKIDSDSLLTSLWTDFQTIIALHIYWIHPHFLTLNFCKCMNSLFHFLLRIANVRYMYLLLSNIKISWMFCRFSF